MPEIGYTLYYGVRIYRMWLGVQLTGGMIWDKLLSCSKPEVSGYKNLQGPLEYADSVIYVYDFGKSYTHKQIFLEIISS